MARTKNRWKFVGSGKPSRAPMVAAGSSVCASRRLGEEGSGLSYRDVHRVVACGSFVAALSHVDIGEREMAVVDLFRVEGGLIVEHWDVMEEILPRERWVNSGKF